MRLKIFSCACNHVHVCHCVVYVQREYSRVVIFYDYLKTGIDNNIHGFNFAAISHCKFLQTQCI